MADQAKNVRRTRKSALTKSISRLDRLIAEDVKEEVMAHMEKMKETFNNFEHAHEKYNELIDNPDDVDTNDQDFYTEEKKYIAALEKAKKYAGIQSGLEKKDEGSKDVKPGSSTDFNAHDIFKLFNAPRIELEIFNGDPLKYHSFMAMVEETIDPLKSDGKMKVTRLMQCTEGKARDAIRSCILLDGNDGYVEAKKILLHRFGSEHLIMDRIVSSLRSGKLVKSPEDVENLSDEMSGAFKTLKQMNKLPEIDSQMLILEVIRRFPFYVQNKWKRFAMEYKRTNLSYPDFEQLVDFVEKESDEMNDPVYSQLNARSSGLKKSIPKASSSSFATEVREPFKRPPCILCKKDHKLLYCPSFKEMKPRDRLHLVKENKLCENCLLGNHSTSKCRKPTVCTIAGCGKKHTKFIHVNDHGENVDANPSRPTPVKIANASYTDVKVHMPAVAVIVNDKCVSSALLDNASSSTFCTRRLADSLGLSGQKKNLEISTLNFSRSVESRVVTLDVVSLDRTESLQLHNVFVVDKIPNTVPVVDTRGYKHLQDLNFAGAGKEVEILIGQDNGEALVPLETRKGQVGQPFAVRTLLGWTLNGPGNLNQKVSQSVIAHFISANESIESNIEALWTVENEGLCDDEKSWSPDDVKVIDLWDAECEIVNEHYQLPIPFKPNVDMPNNVKMVVGRLKSTRSSLIKRGLLSKYDDDCLKSVSTREDALAFIEGSKGVLQKAGFKLTKFVANDDCILSSIPESDRAKEVKDLNSKSNSKALGTKWCVEDDKFFFDIDVSCQSVTRRKILSVVSSVFDPLGLVSPVVITGKMILQDATRMKLQWDDELPGDLQDRWRAWLAAVSKLACLRIPRCMKPKNFDDANIQLHHFSDASQRAYGCCTFIRCVNQHGEIHVMLVMSKAKVAPLKCLTIPWLFE
jgi:hypothetical protein